ncbi:MAG: hypothetical protein WCD89_19990 [Anaerocolumna sp.]
MNRAQVKHRTRKDGYMGMFPKKKLKLERIMREDIIQYFIDYHKIKEPGRFLMDFIQDIIENRNSFLVIDTDNFYDKNHSEKENKITDLKEDLNKQGISYKEVITKKEADNKILGIKIEKSAKVNHYQIGLSVAPDQLRKVTGMLKEYNVFYYITVDNTETEELIKQFCDARGNYEDLNILCSFDLYNDSYFNRIRICSRQDITNLLDMKLQKYQE